MPLSLCAGDEPDWFGETVVAGMKIDAQNLARDWLKAEVVEVHRHDAVVHFLGWEKVYDRFLPLRSDLMAEYDTKTEGIDTRGSLDGDEDFEVSAAALAPYMLKIDGILSGAATRAEAVSQTLLPPRCLRSGAQPRPRSSRRRAAPGHSPRCRRTCS